MNNLRYACRHLTRSRLYSLLNISGLAVGIAVSFLLLLYVGYEYSYDNTHVNRDRLFLAFKNQPAGETIKTKSIMPAPLADVLKKDFPEIEQTARMHCMDHSLISFEEKGLKVNTVAADPSLNDLFTLDFVYGNKQSALSGSSSIVLTQSVSEALFGQVDPVGKVIRFNNQYPLTVNGVIRDHPSNSSLSFKAMISWEGLIAHDSSMKDAGWGFYNFNTWVLLKKGASIDRLNEKVKDLIGKYNSDDAKVKMFLFPLSRLHLYNVFKDGHNVGGRIDYMRLFLVLAIGILIIACINFMNLSTARSEKQVREVGVRKAIGANRFALIQQFMTSSLLTAFLAFTLAIGLLILALPVFNRIVNVQLVLPFDNITVWILAIGITIVTGLLAGSYPALFLSSFNPVEVLKGKLKPAGNSVRSRQILVVVQFTFSICLILSSIFIYKQVEYIKDRPKGYDSGGLIEMPADGKIVTSFEGFRQEAIASGAITDAALTSDLITNNTASSWDVRWPEQKPGEEKIPIDCIGVTYHFLSTYGLQLTQGRDFDPARPADSTAVILNEAAVKLMHMKEPVGQQITWLDSSHRTVVGVVKNFVWGSPYEPVKPAIVGFIKEWSNNIGVKLNPSISISAALSRIQSICKKYNPEYPFEYTFTDENFGKKYGDEKLLGTVSISFTSLAIFISCLGLFGLASFSAEQRKKEISIRKVLGAGTARLWFNLSNEFVKLVMIAFIVGSSISWFCIHQWLISYTYHTSLSASPFFITFFMSLVICLTAVSWQALKAATTNPVNSLRSE